MQIIQNLTWQSVASAQGPVCSITINYSQSAVWQIGLWGSYLQSVVYPTALVVDLTTSDYNATVNINGISTLVSARTLQGFAIQKGVAYLTITGESDQNGVGPTGSIPITFYARQSDAPANVQNFLALIAQALAINPGNPSVDFNANHFLAWAGEHAYKFGAVTTPVDVGSDGHNLVATVDGTAAPNTYGLIVGTNNDPPVTAPVYASRYYIGQGGPSFASDQNGNPAIVSKNAGSNAYASILESDGSTLASLFAKQFVAKNGTVFFDTTTDSVINTPVANGTLIVQDANQNVSGIVCKSSQNDNTNRAVNLGVALNLFHQWKILFNALPPTTINLFGSYGDGIYSVAGTNTSGSNFSGMIMCNSNFGVSIFSVGGTTTFFFGSGTEITGYSTAYNLIICRFGAS